MIYLASSSSTRMAILTKFNIEFKQIAMKYDESFIEKIDPKTYSVKVVNEKSKQFFLKFKNKFDRVLFVDSSVVCKDLILCKPASKNEARQMLNLQSGSIVSIYTAIKFLSSKFNIDMLSVATYEFSKFDDKDMNDYLSSNLWHGKAGAMAIESFNKKYILKSWGNKTTAMGLDIQNLKAFL